jgi:PAS domain S-box-containing protein
MSLIMWLHLIQNFWHWGVGALAAGATIADAMRGFRTYRAVFVTGVSNVFGQAALRKDMEKMSADLTAQLQLIAKELKPNSGSSLRDVVNAIDKRQVFHEERYKAMNSDTPDGIQEFDPTGGLVWCNRTYQRFVNRDFTELKGMGWLNTICYQDRQKVTDEWLEAVAQGRDYEATFRILNSESHIIEVIVKAHMMKSQGQLIGYVASVDFPKK